MNTSTALRASLPLIVLVSCAHALVHSFELALPSVEQEVAADFHPDDLAAGKQLSGSLSTTWRFFWGVGALIAGFCVDRIGAARMLIIFLLGCSLMCIATGFSYELPLLVGAMLLMGAFASIYHPAGLDLITGITDASNRSRAMGIHGIFGSIGIASAPFIAWVALSNGMNWRQYYLLLALPGFFIAVLLAVSTRRRMIARINSGGQAATRNIDLVDDGRANWTAFWVLTLIAILQGFVYSAQMSFLPRYLSTVMPGTDGLAMAGDALSTVSPESSSLHSGKLLASGALILGCIGQYLAGRIAKADRLERQIAMVTLANVPFLIWMALATDGTRFVAAGAFCIVHFMHQPLYNSLIPKYAPARKRSFCFGISFAMGLGLGSLGAIFAGRILNEQLIYFTLAGVSTTAGFIGLGLARIGGQTSKA